MILETTTSFTWNSETEFSLCLLPMLSVGCASLSVLLKKHNHSQLLLKTILLCRLQNIIAVQIFQETSCGTLIPGVSAILILQLEVAESKMLPAI